MLLALLACGDRGPVEYATLLRHTPTCYVLQLPNQPPKRPLTGGGPDELYAAADCTDPKGDPVGLLNTIGAAGWHLIAVQGDLMVFERPK